MEWKEMKTVPMTNVVRTEREMNELFECIEIFDFDTVSKIFAAGRKEVQLLSSVLSRYCERIDYEVSEREQNANLRKIDLKK